MPNCISNGIVRFSIPGRKRQWFARSSVLCLLMFSGCAIYAQPPSTKVEGTDPPSTQPAAAAEAPPAKEVETAPAKAEDFDRLSQEWTALDRQLQNLIQNYQDAIAPAMREKILADYRKFTNESKIVLKQLREAAVAHYTASPNQNPKVTQTIVEFIGRDFRQDKLEDASALIKLLEDHQSDAKPLATLHGLVAYHMDDFEAAEKFLKAAEAAGPLSRQAEMYLSDIETAKKLWREELAVRKLEADAELPRVKIKTDKGDIVLELFENEAPETVGNFISLIESGFYQGSPFHRVLPNFMAQGGSNSEDGRGGAGYQIYDECQRDDHRKHFRGTLSMANTGQPNSGGSQFFITFCRTPQLDGKHTVFGRVIEGWDVLPKIQRRDPQLRGQPPSDHILSIEILRKRDHTYVPHKVER